MAQACLQKSLWAMAASQSSHFYDLGDSLYQDTRQMLKSLDSGEGSTDTLCVENVQTGLLLALYELNRGTVERALIRMGWAIRMVQLMRLHEIDDPGHMQQRRGLDDPIEAEEHRRALWVAYILENYVSISRGLPLTLSEQEVRSPSAD